jgi:phosphatidylinositol glycan class U
MDQQKALLFGAAAAVRLLLFTAFPSLPNLLAGRVEVSTPVTSFKRLQEGLFLYTHNVSPYDGGIYHQVRPTAITHTNSILTILGTPPSPPLLPPTKSGILPVCDKPVVHCGRLTGGGCVDANCGQWSSSDDKIVQVFKKGPALEQRRCRCRVCLISNHLEAQTKYFSYLFNPFTVATCIARSTSALNNLFILAAIAKAAQGASITFVFALSLAAYLSLHPILLFPPLLILCYDARASKSKSAPSPFAFTATHTVGLAAASGGLLWISALLTGSWEFLTATYGVRLLLSDLTPTVGLWWYFFIEMFDSFREFFLGVFWLHVASYMPGLTIRLRKQPLFVATTLAGIFAVFTPYPSIADAALYLSLMPLFRHLFPCECIIGLVDHYLTMKSDAIHILGLGSYTVRHLPRASLLLPLDLRWLWKCQLLLCHHASLELGSFCHHWRLALRCLAG